MRVRGKEAIEIHLAVVHVANVVVAVVVVVAPLGASKDGSPAGRHR